MTTIKEIAEKCGVSIGTVDRVLHNRGSVKPETRNRVWQAARELDYRPNQAAQGLAIRKKKLRLGMILPDCKDHPFFRRQPPGRGLPVTIVWLSDLSMLPLGSHHR